jgi:hypothetical protein
MRNRRTPKRKHIQHERAQRVHACRRALKRFDIVLTDELRRTFIHLIETGKLEKIRESLRRRGNGLMQVYAVQHAGKDMHIVYDTVTRNIVSFLYPDPTMYLYEMVKY